MIRLTGGSLRGRSLKVPAGIRPTTGWTRKAAFDLVGDAVCGARVLDAAAGSGAYGIEALSRGAAEATFVEREPRAARALRANLEGLGLAGASTVVVAAVEDWLRASAQGAPSFDLVFFDPPYAEAAAGELTGLLGLVAPGGILVHERGDPGESLAGVGPPERRRRYGAAWLLVFRR